MIVDACDDVNLTFRIVLSESDRRLRVQSFTDPVDALREFKSDFYHLVIINILLSKMNGFELYDKLRCLDGKVKICFMTTGSEIILKKFMKEAFPELESKLLYQQTYCKRGFVKTSKRSIGIKVKLVLIIFLPL